MNLLSALNAVVNHIGTAETRAGRQARLEHDEWTLTVQPGVTYYTALPVTDYNGTPIHNTYVFGKRVRAGANTGQWLTACGMSTSWRAWSSWGPLTTERRPTVADYNLRQKEISDAFERGMEPSVTRRFLADHPEIGREYPATAAAFAGAR